MSTNEVLREVVNGLKNHYEQQVTWHNEVMAAIGYESAFDSYQKQAYEFAVYKDPIYPVLALAEEAGEVSALFAKAKRKGCEVDPVQVLDELSDVLWNLSAIATEHGLELKDIAAHNLEKLRMRRENDTIVER